MLKDLQRICEHFYGLSLSNKKNETFSREAMVSGEQCTLDLKELLESDESISMLEKTAVRLMPILNQVVARMVRERELPGSHREQPAPRKTEDPA